MHLTREQRALLIRMALVSYGGVQRFGGRRGESGALGPPGESSPMHDKWAVVFVGAADPDMARRLTEEAQAELDAWVRRPLAPDTTETWEEIAARIVGDGWGLASEECAMAMRCTPTMVRRARLAEMRHPDTGYHLPAPHDPITWAIQLDGLGLTLRQIETVTGVAKSTLHDRLRARRPGATRRGAGAH